MIVDESTGLTINSLIPRKQKNQIYETKREFEKTITFLTGTYYKLFTLH